MHCKACQVLLTPYEESKCYAGTNIKLELCNTCHDVIRDDLAATDDDWSLADEIEEIGEEYRDADRNL